MTGGNELRRQRKQATDGPTFRRVWTTHCIGGSNGPELLGIRNGDRSCGSTPSVFSAKDRSKGSTAVPCDNLSSDTVRVQVTFAEARSMLVGYELPKGIFNRSAVISSPLRVIIGPGMWNGTPFTGGFVGYGHDRLRRRKR